MDYETRSTDCDQRLIDMWLEQRNKPHKRMAIEGNPKPKGDMWVKGWDYWNSLNGDND